MENVKFKPLVQELMDMARHLRAASSQDYDEQYKALQQRLYQELEAADKRERTLRRLLAVTYAGSTLYTDDGELSDSRQHPGIDFKRMDPMFIEAAMRERSMHQWESLCAKDTVLGRWAAPLIDQEIPFKFEQNRRQVMVLSRGQMNPTYGAIALCDRIVVRDIFAMCDWIRERGLVQL